MNERLLTVKEFDVITCNPDYKKDKYLKYLPEKQFTEFDEFVRKQTPEEDVEALALRVQELCDDELNSNNPAEEYLTELKSEISAFQTGSSRILNYSTSSSVDVDYYEEDGYSFARMYGTYYLQVQKNLKSLEEVFVFRKDSDGHWKLYGWQPVENTENAQMAE